MNKLCKSLERLLDRRTSEEPLHQFLAQHPVFLRQFGMSPPVVSKPSIGLDSKADFATLTVGNDYYWSLIEIERCSHRLFTRKGLPSQALNTAISQVRDWLIALRSNHAVPGFGLFSGGVSAIIIIGRRKDLSRLERMRLRSLNETSLSIRVATWDTLLDPLQTQSDKLIENQEREAFRVISDAEFRRTFGPGGIGRFG